MKNRHFHTLPGMGNSYFRKTLLVFGIILTISIVFSSLFITNFLKKPLRSSIAESHQALLSRLASMSDMSIIKQANSILMQNFTASTARISNNHSLQKYSEFFTAREVSRDNTMQFYNLYNILSGIETNYDFIESIAIYNENIGVSISTFSGVSYTAAPPMISGAEFDAFKNSAQSTMWISPKENAAIYPDDMIITLLSKQRFETASESEVGYIMLNINMNSITGYIDSLYTDTDSKLLVADKNGKIFAANYNFLRNDENISWIFEHITAEKSGIASPNKHSIVWVRSNVNDWIYICVTPAGSMYKKISRASWITAVFTLLTLIIMCFFLFVATAWLQKPIKKLIAKTSKFSDDEPDEFKRIDNVIERLSNRVNHLNNTLGESKSLIRNQIAMDILNGNFTSAEEINSRFGLIDIDYSYPYYRLIFTKISSSMFSVNDWRSREILYCETLNHIDEYWNRFGFCTSVRYNNFIISILATESENYTESPQISDLKISSSINICICRPVSNLKLLRTDFQKMTEYMQYSFIYGYGNVFTDTDIEKYENCCSKLGERTFSDIEESLKRSAVEETKQYICSAAAEIKQNGLSYHYTNTALLQIINIMCTVIHNQGFSSADFDKIQILNHFTQAETLDDFLDWILNLLDVYAANRSLQNENINKDYINRITSYIDSNITNDLTLKSVADSFSISQSYLSKIFKETCGINFSTYLIGKKFDYAADLLINNENMTVSEIAQKLGYYNVTYFTQQFKTRFGVSPIQYRKINIQK